MKILLRKYPSVMPRRGEYIEGTMTGVQITCYVHMCTIGSCHRLYEIFGCPVSVIFKVKFLFSANKVEGQEIRTHATSVMEEKSEEESKS